MLIELIRSKAADGSKTKGFTAGNFHLDHAAERTCHSLEDEDREVPGQSVASWKIPGETAIPCGLYDVTIDFSNRFKKNMLHILDVPGFEGVRIHGGNTPENTEGCPLAAMELLEDDGSEVHNCAPAVDKIFHEVETSLNAGKKVRIWVGYDRAPADI